MSSIMKRLFIVVIVLFVLFVGFRIWALLYPDWLWFKSPAINMASVFSTMLITKIVLGLGFGALFLVITLGNAFLLWKFALSKAAEINVIPIYGTNVNLGKKMIIVAILLLCLVLSVIAGSGGAIQWEPYLRYTNSAQLSFSQVDPEGYRDPIFGKDIAYYVFKMPFLRFVRGWLFLTFLFLTAGTGVIYALFGGTSSPKKSKLSKPMRTHLFLLASITLFLLAWGRIFSMYELLAAETTVRHGWVYGVGYTDAMARIPVYKIMMYVAIITGIVFLVSIFVRKAVWLGIGGVILFVLISMLGTLIYPWIVQRFQVEPQEFDKEKKYIEYNIKYTRRAYNLNNVTGTPYSGTGELTLEDITENKAIMENIRLWDWRPLRDVFRQREARRPQYNFNDVDVDRYIIDGQVRQVMLSARELFFSKVKRESQTWVNRTFVYTHGHGLTMIPVSEIQEGGLPRMYINDIPPKIHDPWKQEITRPEIYYGEGERVSFRSEMGRLPYIIVNPGSANPEEFDYPQEDRDTYTSYAGIGGVEIKSFWRRLAFAFKFSEDMRNILFSGKINNNSKILLHRSISERVRTIAPFLKYDKDPYLVTSQGRLYWVMDAYTTTHNYPYSEPMIEQTTEVMQYGRATGTRIREQRIWGNYIRNSVKVIIDAYDGTVDFYIMTKEPGQEDPIADCYRNIFPSLFKDFSQMPDDLKQHIRYPLTLFMIQADKYSAYHMNDAQQFYYKEDLWQIGTEKYQAQGEIAAVEQPVEPYYLILQLPGSDKEEFILMIPYTPYGKQNMVAWLGAKCDINKDGTLGEYGNLVVYNFPKGELIDGTIQIEAYIDQDEEISSQLSLWSQRGSSVIRGNLLAIPIKESMLYVEPIYLQAESTAIPQLKRVVVSLGGKSVVWGEDLQSALAALYGRSIPTRIDQEAEQKPAMVERDEVSKGLAGQAIEQYNRAQEYLRNGQWSRYGEEMNKLQKTLQELQKKAE